MTAQILDGRSIAREIQSDLKLRIEKFVQQQNRRPVLAALLVGDDPASHVYVRNKESACAKVGIESRLHRMPGSTTSGDLLDKLGELNSDEDVNAILVQLPLPAHVDSQIVLDAVDPLKDADAFHPHNVGLISQGRPRFLPCTPHGVMRLIHRYGITTSGRRVVIVGRSDIVGKPLALMLANRDSPYGPELANATVTICHSHTRNLRDITRSAEILIAAIGKPRFISSEMIAPGSVVVDVGINRTSEGLVGDVDYDAALEIASFVSPVPGGVGPLTVSMLMENTLTAATLHARRAAEQSRSSS
jgi:methylenetetrahydrofolate dehydrogenase (NADP+)/methenyltetrahydrofolate cyclohydrolase